MKLTRHHQPPGSLLFLWYIAFLSLCTFSSLHGATESYEAGWFPWDPYQYEDGATGQLTGLNVELGKAVFERMELPVTWRQIEWQAHLSRMESGESALAVGASKTTAREAYAWFSDPFFDETIVFVGRSGENLDSSIRTPQELLAASVADGRRLAVIGGYFYGAEVMEFLETLPEAQLAITPDDHTSLRKLLAGEIDGFLAERLAATTVAWRQNELEAIDLHPVELSSTSLYVMFSKAVFDASVVEAFNEALAEVMASGEVRRIKRQYLLPVLLEVTLHTNWFLIVSMIGVFSFGLSGVFIARKEGYDIAGAFLLVSLPALGGGILRDILIDRHPVWVLRPPYYYIAIVLALVIGAAIIFQLIDWLARRRPAFSRRITQLRVNWASKLITMFDALGLAAFIIIGVVIAAEQRMEPLWLWGSLLAALSGSGGAILRDVVRAKAEVAELKGDIYPEIALVWGLIFVFFLEWQVDRLNLTEIALGVVVLMLGAFATRMLSFRYNIRSPLFSPKQRHSSGREH